MITFVAVGIIQLIEAEKLKYLDQLSVSCFYPEPPALRRRFVAPYVPLQAQAFRRCRAEARLSRCAI